MCGLAAIRTAHPDQGEHQRCSVGTSEHLLPCPNSRLDVKYPLD